MSTLLVALDPTAVKPGWLGLVVTLLMALALALLMINFSRRLKRVDVDREQGPDPDRVAPPETRPPDPRRPV